MFNASFVYLVGTMFYGVMYYGYLVGTRTRYGVTIRHLLWRPLSYNQQTTYGAC